MIRLESSHVLISGDIVDNIFSNIQTSYVAYNPIDKKLYLSPVTSDWFKIQFPKPLQIMIKSKSTSGEKALAIHGILIDYDLDEIDRDLEFEIEPEYHLIKITI